MQQVIKNLALWNQEKIKRCFARWQMVLRDMKLYVFKIKSTWAEQLPCCLWLTKLQSPKGFLPHKDWHKGHSVKHHCGSPCPGQGLELDGFNVPSSPGHCMILGVYPKTFICSPNQQCEFEPSAHLQCWGMCSARQKPLLWEQSKKIWKAKDLEAKKSH